MLHLITNPVLLIPASANHVASPLTPLLSSSLANGTEAQYSENLPSPKNGLPASGIVGFSCMNPKKIVSTFYNKYACLISSLGLYQRLTRVNLMNPLSAECCKSIFALAFLDLTTPGRFPLLHFLRQVRLFIIIDSGLKVHINHFRHLFFLFVFILIHVT